MPQELLRDVLRTGDASHRQRHWSVLPLDDRGARAPSAIMVIARSARTSISPPIPVASESRRPSSRTIRRSLGLRSPASCRCPASRTWVRRSTAPRTIVPEPSPQPRVGWTWRRIRGVEGGTGRSRSEHRRGDGPPAPLRRRRRRTPKIFRVGARRSRTKEDRPRSSRVSGAGQARRVEGTVILEAVVDVAGRVEQVRVLRSVALLDDAAIQAVQQWRYSPTELNGVPVPVLMTVTVRSRSGDAAAGSDNDCCDARRDLWPPVAAARRRRSATPGRGAAVLRAAAGGGRRRLPRAVEQHGEAADRETVEVRLRLAATTSSPSCRSSLSSRRATGSA